MEFARVDLTIRFIAVGAKCLIAIDLLSPASNVPLTTRHIEVNIAKLWFSLVILNTYRNNTQQM
jgi:hypothetical protein